MICHEHLERLTNALKEHGIYHLVPDSKEEFFENIESWENVGLNALNFDPMTGAQSAICEGAVYNLVSRHKDPTELMSPRDDGRLWCPICYLNIKDNTLKFDSWINDAAEQMLEIYEELNDESL